MKAKNVLVFDTNALINMPHVLTRVPSDWAILFVDTVVGELEKKAYMMPIDSEMSKKIQIFFDISKTLSNARIVGLYDSKYLGKIVGNQNVLLNHYVADDIILAVTTQFKEFAPILITDDRELLKKCKRHQICGMSLRRFLKEVL